MFGCFCHAGRINRRMARNRSMPPAREEIQHVVEAGESDPVVLTKGRPLADPGSAGWRTVAARLSPLAVAGNGVDPPLWAR